MTCRNCGLKRANRPKGLCWTCYNTEGVKERFPAMNGERSFLVEHPIALAMPEPTDAIPGSDAKVDEIQRRLWAGEFLWHPGDARSDLE